MADEKISDLASGAPALLTDELVVARAGANKKLTVAEVVTQELAYNQITSDVTCTATTEATADTIVTASAITFDGSTTALIEFYCPIAEQDSSGDFRFALYDGSSSIGIIGVMYQSHAADQSFLLMHRLTPAAATKTYSIRGYVSGGNGKVFAGAGGAGNMMPAFIRITKVY